MELDIKVNNQKIHYRETGPSEGAPILLMHGWGCSSKTLLSIENTLNQKMHVFNIDLPGFGESEEPQEVWGVEDYTQAIEALVKELNIDNPILLGHSFGGRISILYGSRNKTKKIILTDAAGVKPRRSMKYYIKVYSYKTIKHLMPLIFGKKKGGELLDKYRGKSGSSDYNQASPMMRAILSKCVNEDLKHVMPQISAPTLLIWGENDTATPLSDAKTMEKLIPDAGLVSFSGCGHYSFLDNPHGYKAVLVEFLKNELK